MRTRSSFLIVLAIVAAGAVLFSCDTAPASQDTESAAAPHPTVAVAAVDSEMKEASVEVGYEVGMRAPAFAMSLLDGTNVTTSSLSAEGKPVFLYFHATY